MIIAIIRKTVFFTLIIVSYSKDRERGQTSRATKMNDSDILPL